MRDIEPYRAILGLTTPWTVADVALDAAGRRSSRRRRRPFRLSGVRGSGTAV